MKRSNQIVLLVSTFLILILSSNAQNKIINIPFSDGDVRIDKVIDGENGKFLLAGKYGFEKNESDYEQDFMPFLGIYDTINKSFIELDYLNNINKGLITDVEVDDNIYLLYDLYDLDNDTVDYAIQVLDNEFELLETSYHLSEFSSDSVFIRAEEFVVLNDSIYVAGIVSQFIPHFGEIKAIGYYSSLLDKQKIINEDTLYNGLSRHFMFDGTTLGDSIVFSVSESAGNSALMLEKSGNINNFNFYSLRMGKGTATGNPDPTPSYNTTGFSDIQYLSEDTLLCNGYTNYLWTFDGFDFYDTTHFTFYFFNNNLDSLKFIPITREFPEFTKNGPGGTHYKGKNKVCLGVTLNNNFGIEKANIPGYDSEMNEYPINKENKVMVAMLNNAGDILWKRVIDSGNQFQYITDVVSTQDGGCMLAGTYYEEGVSNMHDPLLMYFDSIGSVGIDEKPAEILVAKVFPNPANDKIRVEWNPNRLSKSTITVYNLNGKAVLNQNIAIKKNVEVIDINKLSRGSYLIEVKQNNGEKFTSRFVVE